MGGRDILFTSAVIAPPLQWLPLSPAHTARMCLSEVWESEGTNQIQVRETTTFSLIQPAWQEFNILNNTAGPTLLSFLLYLLLWLSGWNSCMPYHFLLVCSTHTHRRLFPQCIIFTTSFGNFSLIHSNLIGNGSFLLLETQSSKLWPPWGPCLTHNIPMN